MTDLEEERRHRVERRARVVTGVSATATIALPALSVVVVYGPGGRTTAVAAAATALLILAVLGVTGWWIDSLRAWWQPERWVHQFRSVVAWLVPVLNLFAITQESRLLLERARASRWIGRCFYVGFVVTVLLSWLRQSWAEPISTGLVGLLPLSLVLLTMRSLRAERAHRGRTTDTVRAGGSAEFG